ncbi:flavin reductase family protein [Aquibacillus sp. 3ASR75-11]|uniref:Flavin reductase family protein n=1 Tax=Terrihalobacillus insolitus TaxID=2950438 RepID=A0A9X4AMC7_9BACI|nr:flavin reductase family protein [Terrihalobacillus insolitus]MDC3411959.1 flavin reductase family protein [Terrihalobacillus insolitus]MDC3423355.1 flavin reductase family protein [Terrihalobacillus insolitus]
MDTKSKLDPVEEVYNKRLRGGFFISTTDGKRTHFHNGCWVTQCSHEPPQMLVCFPKEMESTEIIKRGGVFALSMTAEDQEELMDRFFAGDQSIESMGEDEFIYKETACPILKNAQAYFDCEVAQIIDNRDFLIVIGNVLSAEILHPEKQSLTVNHLMEREGGVPEDAIVPLKGFDNK